MAVTFNVTYQNGAAPAMNQQADIVYACNAWGQTFANTLDVNVHVWATDMTGSGLNGICIPGIVQAGGHTLTRPLAKAMGHLAALDPAIDLVVALDTQTNWVLGNGPNVNVGFGQCSLTTTMIHELCHGLGFGGLCNVSANPNQGIYSDVALTQLVTQVAGNFNPAVQIPGHFFPNNLQVGQMTPFANLFTYTNNQLQKGNAADDFTAFTTPNTIQVTARGTPYTVLSQNNFQPFTTCDHITGAGNLMFMTTAGQYHRVPDLPSKQILHQIGWTVAEFQLADQLANPNFQAAAFNNNGFVTAAAANTNVRRAVQQSYQGIGDRTLSWISPRDWINQYLR